MAAKQKWPIANLRWKHYEANPTMSFNVDLPKRLRLQRSIARNIDANDYDSVRQLIIDTLALGKKAAEEVGMPFNVQTPTEDEIMGYVGMYKSYDEKDQKTYNGIGYSVVKENTNPSDAYIPKRRQHIDDWHPHEAVTRARSEVATVLDRYGVKR